MKRIALALIVVIIGAIYGCGLLSPTPPPFVLDLSIMPGMSFGEISTHHNCYQMYTNGELLCYAYGYDVSFIIDQRDNTVKRVTYIRSQIVGDFFTVWGTPVGIEDFHLLKYIYWASGKYISVSDENFAPTGRTTLVGFTNDLPRSMKAWRGFRR